MSHGSADKFPLPGSSRCPTEASCHRPEQRSLPVVHGTPDSLHRPAGIHLRFVERAEADGELVLTIVRNIVRRQVAHVGLRSAAARILGMGTVEPVPRARGPTTVDPVQLTVARFASIHGGNLSRWLPAGLPV
jgi:hypothetical protein